MPNLSQRISISLIANELLKDHQQLEVIQMFYNKEMQLTCLTQRVVRLKKKPVKALVRRQSPTMTSHGLAQSHKNEYLYFLGNYLERKGDKEENWP